MHKLLLNPVSMYAELQVHCSRAALFTYKISFILLIWHRSAHLRKTITGMSAVFFPLREGIQSSCDDRHSASCVLELLSEDPP